jgi:hypothetical protein
MRCIDRHEKIESRFAPGVDGERVGVFVCRGVGVGRGEGKRLLLSRKSGLVGRQPNASRVHPASDPCNYTHVAQL